MLVQHLDEARHVRALEVVGQGHVHVEVRDRVLLAGGAVLDAHRMVDVLDADLVDRDAARVGAALHVVDGGRCGRGGVTGRSTVRRPPDGRRRPRGRPAAPATGGRASARGRTASRPAIARQSSREPCSMNWSGMPTCSTSRSMPCAARHSLTALPAPPATAFSSTVTMRSWRARQPADEFLVERLHEAHVDERRVEPLGERLAGRHHRAEGEQQQAAAALAAQLGLAHGQRGHLPARDACPGPGRADSAPPPARRGVTAV